MNKLCIKDISILNKNSEKITGLKLENKDYKFILYSYDDEINDEIINESEQFIKFSFKESFNITSKKKMKDLNLEITQNEDSHILMFNQKPVFYIKDNKPTLNHQHFKIIQKNGELYHSPYLNKDEDEIINQDKKVTNLLSKNDNLINNILKKKESINLNINDDKVPETKLNNEINDHNKIDTLEGVEESQTPDKKPEPESVVEESQTPNEELKPEPVVEESQTSTEESKPEPVVEESQATIEEPKPIVEESKPPTEEPELKEVKIIEFKSIESENKNIKKTRKPRTKKNKKEINNEMSSFIIQSENKETKQEDKIEEKEIKQEDKIEEKETKQENKIEEKESNINLVLNKNESNKSTDNLNISNILDDFNNYIIEESKVKTIPQQNYNFKTKNINFFNKKYIIKPHKLMSSNINIYNLNKIKILKENLLNDFKKALLLDEKNSSYLIQYYTTQYLINKVNKQMILTNLKNKKTILLNDDSFFKLLNYNYYITNNCTTIIPINTKKIFDNSNGMIMNYFEPIIT